MVFRGNRIGNTSFTQLLLWVISRYCEFFPLTLTYNRYSARRGNNCVNNQIKSVLWNGSQCCMLVSAYSNDWTGANLPIICYLNLIAMSRAFPWMFGVLCKLISYHYDDHHELNFRVYRQFSNTVVQLMSAYADNTAKAFSFSLKKCLRVQIQIQSL